MMRDLCILTCVGIWSSLTEYVWCVSVLVHSSQKVRKRKRNPIHWCGLSFHLITVHVLLLHSSHERLDLSQPQNVAHTCNAIGSYSSLYVLLAALLTLL
ncbi:hypothetical protein V8C42DRAFT_307036 [Trichoderma barbatum]